MSKKKSTKHAPAHPHAAPKPEPPKERKAREATVAIANPRWPDTRVATYNPGTETVGTVVDRFANEQGIAEPLTFVLEGHAMDRKARMPELEAGVILTLVSAIGWADATP